MNKKLLWKEIQEYGLLDDFDENPEIIKFKVNNLFRKKGVLVREYYVATSYDEYYINVIECSNLAELQQIKFKLYADDFYLCYVKNIDKIFPVNK